MLIQNKTIVPVTALTCLLFSCISFVLHVECFCLTKGKHSAEMVKTRASCEDGNLCVCNTHITEKKNRMTRSTRQLLKEQVERQRNKPKVRCLQRKISKQLLLTTGTETNSEIQSPEDSSPQHNVESKATSDRLFPNDRILTTGSHKTNDRTERNDDYCDKTSKNDTDDDDDDEELLRPFTLGRLGM